MSEYRLRGKGPYTARSASDDTDNWPFWYVTNDGRTNILEFPGGAVFTIRERAEKIVEIENKKEMK